MGRRAAFVVACTIVSLVPLSACLRGVPETTTDEPPENVATARAPEPARAVTVRVRARWCDGAGQGSGWVLNPKTIVTTAHGVDTAISVHVTDWQGRDVEVDYWEVSASTDLAKIHLRSAIPDVAIQANTDAAAGDTVEASGFPEGDRLEVSTGEVVDVVVGDQFGESGPVTRTEMELKPGNSGGPVMNAAGEVAGMAWAIEIATDYGMMIPISEIATTLDHGTFAKPEVVC